MGGAPLSFLNSPHCWSVPASSDTGYSLTKPHGLAPKSSYDLAPGAPYPQGSTPLKTVVSAPGPPASSTFAQDASATITATTRAAQSETRLKWPLDLQPPKMDTGEISTFPRPRFWVKKAS